MDSYRTEIIKLLDKIENKNHLKYLYEFISEMINLWNHKTD